jgi:serine protease Do
MKKTIMLWMALLMVLTLFGCDSEATIERLEQTHQDIVSDGYQSYLEDAAYINTLSGDILHSAVLVFNYVGASQDSSTGSGVVFMEDETYYYALTNNHVIYVEEGTSHFIRVHDYQGNVYSATVVASDRLYDLAVIRFQKTEITLRLITFAIENAMIGDQIAIIGYPARQINAITLGDVVDYVPIELSQSNTDIVDILFDVVTMDAPVKGGSSGSLVVNRAFELIGVLFAGTREGSDFTRSYAVPIEKVIEFLTLHEILGGGEDDA